MLLEKWIAVDPKNKKEIEGLMPKKVKRRQEQGEGWEEFYDYVFGDDAAEQGKGSKILEMAHKWKSN